MTSYGARIVIAASNAARRLGQGLDSLGKSMEVCKYSDRLVPSTRFVAVDGVSPTVSPLAAFVAPNASVIGDVTLGANSSVWYGATIRGDVHRVTIGENTSVGDRAVVHVAKIQGDFPSIIGSNVTIGQGAIVHAATLLDGCVVGPSAQVLDGSVVGAGAIVGPGAVVTPGTVVGPGEYWLGSPARLVRRTTPEELRAASEDAANTLALALMHAVECDKSMEQIHADKAAYEDSIYRDPEYWQPNAKTSESAADVLGMGSPGLIFDNSLTNPVEGLKVSKKRQAAEEEAAQQK
jgi:carbonic anhydrase/acetyltransferase-like protein (isoleucine patch superfamily)